MRTFLTLSAGLFAGLLASLILVRAGFPPALAGLVLWMTGGVFGLSLLQFAFLKSTIQRSTQATRARPFRAFLLGLLILELPVLAASLVNLAGGRQAAVLLLALLSLGLVLIFWPAAISYHIGQRLAPESSGPGQVLAGSAVLSGTLLVPMLGWAWLLGLGVMATGGCCLTHLPGAGGRYA